MRNTCGWVRLHAVNGLEVLEVEAPGEVLRFAGNEQTGQRLRYRYWGWLLGTLQPQSTGMPEGGTKGCWGCTLSWVQLAQVMLCLILDLRAPSIGCKPN